MTDSHEGLLCRLGAFFSLFAPPLKNYTHSFLLDHSWTLRPSLWSRIGITDSRSECPEEFVTFKFYVVPFLECHPFDSTVQSISVGLSGETYLVLEYLFFFVWLRSDHPGLLSSPLSYSGLRPLDPRSFVKNHLCWTKTCLIHSSWIKTIREREEPRRKGRQDPFRNHNRLVILLSIFPLLLSILVEKKIRPDLILVSISNCVWFCSTGSSIFSDLLFSVRVFCKTSTPSLFDLLVSCWCHLFIAFYLPSLVFNFQWFFTHSGSVQLE
jgi:hypothetical protein